ncbi:MAG: M28 family peptidase [Treponemataceae bacterium]|nr:M28 family peptidase [Treponemataceae bacterium]
MSAPPGGSPAELPQDFLDFIAPGCDRQDFIIRWLAARGVKAVVMPTEGKNHIYVVFPQRSYSPLFRIKTVLAHYDRAEGSPGANDNSAAVFCMMQWAVRLSAAAFPHNIRLFFTDGEESGGSPSEGGVASQGAFALASIFRRLNILDEDVFAFDCMGRGTVPVLSRTALPRNVARAFREKFTQLEQRTERLLQSAAGGTWISVPVSYSDNAGFLARGIPAVAITMLPQEEATRYLLALSQNRALEQFVTNKAVPSGSTRADLEAQLPETWRLLHTGGDGAASLTPESFRVTAAILNQLALSKSMAE